jgi:hypothetical protein
MFASDIVSVRQFPEKLVKFRQADSDRTRINPETADVITPSLADRCVKFANVSSAAFAVVCNNNKKKKKHAEPWRCFPWLFGWQFSWTDKIVPRGLRQWVSFIFLVKLLLWLQMGSMSLVTGKSSVDCGQFFVFFFFFRYRAGPLVGVVALLWRIQRITWLGWQVKKAVGLVTHRIKLFTRAWEGSGGSWGWLRECINEQNTFVYVEAEPIQFSTLQDLVSLLGFLNVDLTRSPVTWLFHGFSCSIAQRQWACSLEKRRGAVHYKYIDVEQF